MIWTVAVRTHASAAGARRTEIDTDEFGKLITVYDSAAIAMQKP
jgi:hypothetical protein